MKLILFKIEPVWKNLSNGQMHTAVDNLIKNRKLTRKGCFIQCNCAPNKPPSQIFIMGKRQDAEKVREKITAIIRPYCHDVRYKIEAKNIKTKEAEWARRPNSVMQLALSA